MSALFRYQLLHLKQLQCAYRKAATTAATTTTIAATTKSPFVSSLSSRSYFSAAVVSQSLTNHSSAHNHHHHKQPHTNHTNIQNHCRRSIHYSNSPFRPQNRVAPKNNNTNNNNININIHAHHRHSKYAFTKTLFERMREVVPEREDYIRKVYAATKDKEISTVTVQQAFQGMRGVKALVCDTSELDIEEGIRFRGLSIPDVQQQLPSARCRALPGEYPLPEGMLWLLLIGEVPTADEVRQLSEELTSEPYNIVPKHARSIIDHLPVHQHPMSQFITGILALQTESRFADAYSKGVHRTKFWKYALDDTLRLIAKIPHVTSRIYRQTFADGYLHPVSGGLDWSANWCEMSGFHSAEFQDLMRMYFTIHTDHEGGNVSAHATKLVGSALSDPYLSYAAGMCGLAGPLHGLANQESLRFILGIKRHLGTGQKCTHEFLEKHVKDLLSSGQVIPGFGHAVLRVTDPRYIIQREFAQKYIPESELFEIVSMLFEVVPPILKTWRGGKVANPYPNLDAHSGCLLYEYGLQEDSFYTVLFGMSRAIGVLSQFVTDRYILAPIERPKSISVKWIADEFNVQV